MWYLAYNILLLLASPVILLILLGKKRCRRGLLQRLGLRLPRRSKQAESALWVHAVSLGEVVAVTPLVHALRKRYPHDRIVVSTVTETGREQLAEERRQWRTVDQTLRNIWSVLASSVNPLEIPFPFPVRS